MCNILMNEVRCLTTMCYRINRTEGGVGLYLSNDFEAKVHEDLCFFNQELAESLFVKISRPQGKNIVLGVIY